MIFQCSICRIPSPCSQTLRLSIIYPNATPDPIFTWFVQLGLFVLSNFLCFSRIYHNIIIDDWVVSYVQIPIVCLVFESHGINILILMIIIFISQLLKATFPNCKTSWLHCNFPIKFSILKFSIQFINHQNFVFYKVSKFKEY